MRIILYLLLSVLFCASAKANMTIEERYWLIRNWLSIDSITHYSGNQKMTMSFPDLGTLVDLMDDTTTYAQAYDNWQRRYCKIARRMSEQALYEFRTKQPEYIQRRIQLEAAQGGM